MRKFRRRRLLVDGFQGRLLLVSLIHFGAILLTFAGALFLPLVAELGNDATSWDQKQVASIQFLALHARLWPSILVLFALLAIHSITVSHRVAGPLYQFRKVFRSIAGGDLCLRVAIRKNDYLTKEANDINEMISSLRGHISKCSEVSQKAVEALEELREATGRESAPELHRAMGRLEVHTRELHEGLGFFRANGAATATKPNAPETTVATALPRR